MKCFYKVHLVVSLYCLLSFTNKGEEISNSPVQEHTAEQTILLKIPSGTKAYYVNITDATGNIISTMPVIFGEKPSSSKNKKRIKFNSNVWRVPEITEVFLDSLSYPGVKAIYYQGLNYEGRSTKVFAYVGFPNNISKNKKVPAVVLVHGGAGTAFPQWVKIWNDSGYAAISMDLEGHQPVIPGHYQATGNLGGPSNNHYQDIDKKIEDQWMYHAVSNVYLAYSILANDAKVDKEQIGISGISWGGIITSIAIGNSDCFAFAVPVYGCGYLLNSHGAIKNDYTEKVAELWDYANWSAGVKTPSMWINGDSDFAFSIDATAKTVKHTKTSSIVILPSYPHSHLDGWTPREIYAYANSITRKQPRPIIITKQPDEIDPSFSFVTSGSADIKSIELIYSIEPFHYNSDNKITNTWLHMPVSIN